MEPAGIPAVAGLECIGAGNDRRGLTDIKDAPNEINGIAKDVATLYGVLT